MTQPRTRLPLRDALGEALTLWAAMMSGAGGVLAASAVLGVAAASGLVDSVSLPLAVAYGLMSLIALSAVTRIGVVGDVEAARAAGLGPQGFQVGRTEARLAGAILLLTLFFAIILSLLGLTALALFGAAGLDVEALKARDWAGVGAPWKLGLLTLIGLGLIAAPLLLAVRVSLFAQATVGRGRMTSLGATALTNGAIIPLFLGLSIIVAPGLIWLVAATALRLGAEWGMAGWVLIQALIQTPLTAGFLGAAWRRLEGSGQDLAPL